MNQILVNRRRFLQAVVMGIAATSIPNLHKLGATGTASSEEEIEILCGTLYAMGQGWLEIHDGENYKRLQVSENTSIWKGFETSCSSLTKGDDIMVKVLKRDIALRIWANLGRAQGVITGFRKSGFVLKTIRYCSVDKEIFVETLPHTLWQGGQLYPSPTSGKAENGNIFVDVIGEVIPEGLRASLIYLVPQTDERFENFPEQEISITPSGPYCTYSYAGYASWFNCPTGAGRCGTCNTSRSDQCAWPALDTCGSCSWNCCDCSKGCKNQIYLWCGKDVKVIDLCQNKSRIVYIADCGPCQNCSDFCSRKCNDCKGYVTPVIDLTRPTFAYFYDPATRGCFSCRVEVTVLCP
jgi:hypothetical protein